MRIYVVSRVEEYESCGDTPNEKRTVLKAAKSVEGATSIVYKEALRYSLPEHNEDEITVHLKGQFVITPIELEE